MSGFQILYAVEQLSSLFSSRNFCLCNRIKLIKVIHDISRQIEQRARIGEIFAL